MFNNTIRLFTWVFHMRAKAADDAARRGAEQQAKAVQQIAAIRAAQERLDRLKAGDHISDLDIARLGEMVDRGAPMDGERDPMSMVAATTRDAYNESVRDRKHYAEKVRYYTAQKAARPWLFRVVAVSLVGLLAGSAAGLIIGGGGDKPARIVTADAPQPATTGEAQARIEKERDAATRQLGESLGTTVPTDATGAASVGGTSTPSQAAPSAPKSGVTGTDSGEAGTDESTEDYGGVDDSATDESTEDYGGVDDSATDDEPIVR